MLNSGTQQLNGAMAVDLQDALVRFSVIKRHGSTQSCLFGLLMVSGLIDRRRFVG